ERARLTETPAPAEAAPAAKDAAGTRSPKTRGASLPYEADAMAVGDFDGVGKPQAVLASGSTIRLYAYPVLDSHPLVEAAIPGTGLRIVGLSSGRLDGDSRDSLFVSVYDAVFDRFETRVMKVDSGKWLKTAELPYLTRSYQDGTGAEVLGTQQILDDRTFPLGRIYPLVYKDGRYAQGRPELPYRRADWLFGFTTVKVAPDEVVPAYLTSSHALRLQFKGKSWRTAEGDYGQTPVRVRWKGRLLEFNPPMTAAYGPDGGLKALYAARNLPALGGLAAPFGLFNRAQLRCLSWNGLGLDASWTADLPGSVQGLALVRTASGGEELAVAIRGSAGTSSVWTFEP
ncbi:MAG: hypothetical protein KGM24_08330, partial [Elusimicrobia bacterium]|nr:hypothetical protein [Elusimicrobiota bacterium]